MELGFFQKHGSWFLSASITALVVLWLLSGQLDNGETHEQNAQSTTTSHTITRSSVRVRTQSAEEVQRTIVVNGKTAPARIVELSAETDGRVVFIGAERGRNISRGELIVRLDERDRSARLAQAKAIVASVQRLLHPEDAVGLHAARHLDRGG